VVALRKKGCPAQKDFAYCGFTVRHFLAERPWVAKQTAAGSSIHKPVRISQTQKLPNWQAAAGGKMEFEVASIRIGEPDKFTPPNFALNTDDTSHTGVA
jgi:hypothetical protein